MSPSREAAHDLATDVDRLRAETHGCGNVAHFYHAGSSLMPENDLQTVVGRRQREAGIADDEAADEAADRLEAVYDPTARLIGALPTENGIVENATRRWDMAFYSTPFQADDRILPSAAEYTTTVIAFHPVTERGASIEVLPDDEHGQFDVRALEAMLNDGVRMTSINC